MNKSYLFMKILFCALLSFSIAPTFAQIKTKLVSPANSKQIKTVHVLPNTTPLSSPQAAIKLIEEIQEYKHKMPEAAIAFQDSTPAIVEWKSNNKDNFAEKKKTGAIWERNSLSTPINAWQALALGYTENQTKAALSKLGKAQEQMVGAWTVLTYYQPQSNNSTLQVYLHHGLVEAYRVFDSKKVKINADVHIGDQLNLVKLKLGEPAFILADSYTNSIQNFVYPLNDLSIQLERLGENTQPQVVSILVFNK